jgi:ferric-dicitrate binding protein FerR (iron transport regulator)
MGQAKQRGTFEQRQAEAIQRETERQERHRIELAERKERQRQYDLAHPKQAAARRTRNHRASLLMATVAGMGAIGLASLAGTPDAEGASDGA